MKFSIELLHNHRPPAPPTEYFQFNVGGYDTANLLRTNSGMPELQGFIGCVRGLKIGDNLIDLAVIAEENIARGKWVVREILSYAFQNILLEATPVHVQFMFIIY